MGIPLPCVIIIIIIIIITEFSAQGQVLHCKRMNRGCSSAEGRSSTATRTKAAVLPWINRCGSFPLISAPHCLFSIWKDPRGASVEVRKLDLANWVLQTSLKFITGVKYQLHQVFFYHIRVDPGSPVVIKLATGSEVRGFKPGRDRWMFQSLNILSMTSFWRELKPLVPCRRYTARKRTSSRN